jgi:hypothetical protein
MRFGIVRPLIIVVVKGAAPLLILGLIAANFAMVRTTR